MTNPIRGSGAVQLATVTQGAIGVKTSSVVGVVKTVAGAVVTVTIGGTDVQPAGRCGAYTPAVGDVVVLLLQDTSWLIIDKIIKTGA